MYEFVCFGAKKNHSSFRYMYRNTSDDLYYLSTTSPGVMFANIGSILQVKRPYQVDAIDDRSLLTLEQVERITERLNGNLNQFIMF